MASDRAQRSWHQCDGLSLPERVGIYFSKCVNKSSRHVVGMSLTRGAAACVLLRPARFRGPHPSGRRQCKLPALATQFMRAGRYAASTSTNSKKPPEKYQTPVPARLSNQKAARSRASAGVSPRNAGYHYHGSWQNMYPCGRTVLICHAAFFSSPNRRRSRYSRASTERSAPL